MRDSIDEFLSQVSYYVDEVRIRVGLDRDDPVVDTRRRAIVVIILCVAMAILGGWWYATHSLVLPATEQATESSNADAAASTALELEEPQDSSTSTAATSPADTDTTESPIDATCDPNYSPCIPNVSGDLNCADVGKTVKVIGVDRYELDNDYDSYGCDSYSN